MDSNKSRIKFDNAEGVLPVAALIKVMTLVAKKEGLKILSLDYHFVSREIIKGINTKYLNHSYETDIITFDYNRGSKVCGEIYICPDVVNENAIEFSVTKEEELARVIFHGLLHLVGYNDGTVQEKGMMRKKEKECLFELAKHEE